MFQYNKSRLAAAYKTSGALSRVLALISDKIKIKRTHNDLADSDNGYNLSDMGDYYSTV